MKYLHPWNVCAHDICVYPKYLRIYKISAPHQECSCLIIYNSNKAAVEIFPANKRLCARKCRRPNSYYLGSAESSTSVSFSVRLKSSLSDGVASPPCSPQVGSALRNAQLIWAASLPYCTGLLYRHDLPEYSRPIKCSQLRIFSNTGPASLLSRVGGRGRGGGGESNRPCSTCNLNTCRSLFLISPFCWGSLSR